MSHLKVGNTTYGPDILPALPHPTWTISRAHFATPESMVDYVESRSMDQAWSQSPWESRIEFAGPPMLDTFEMCRAGWPQGAEQAARLRDKINAAHPHGQRLTKWDIAGAYPSVPRYLAGNPMNMRAIDSTRLRRKPVLTLVHHMGGMGSITAPYFLNKAAVVAAIVDSIEAAGFQVELMAASVTHNAQNAFIHETAFTVKEAGQPLDIGRIAFSCGHVAAFRRLVWAVRCLNKANEPLTVTMGTTLDYATRPDATYILPSMNTCSDSFATEQLAATAGLHFFLQELVKQECPAFNADSIPAPVSVPTPYSPPQHRRKRRRRY